MAETKLYVTVYWPEVGLDRYRISTYSGEVIEGGFHTREAAEERLKELAKKNGQK